MFTIYDEPESPRYMMNRNPHMKGCVFDEPESPKEGACFRVYDEPESPDEGACLRYMFNNANTSTSDSNNNDNNNNSSTHVCDLCGMQGHVCPFSFPSFRTTILVDA